VGILIRSILVIRLRAFGDTLLSTPLLRSLKLAYPEARLDVLVEPGMAPLLSGLPYVDGLVLFDRPALKARGWWPELKASLALYARLRQSHYDLVLDPLGTPRTAWMCLATGAAVRVGFDFRGRRWAYTKRVPIPQERQYMALVTAELLKPLGLGLDGLALDFPLSPEARDWARQALAGLGFGPQEKPVLASPAGGWGLKRYAPEKLGQALALLGRQSLVLWGPGEQELAQAVAGAAQGSAQLAPKTSFQQLAGLIAEAGLVLSCDGANKHLAVALGTPSLTLFGPTSWVAWHPPADPRHQALHLGLDCMPCEALECRLPRRACLDDLEPAQVAEAARGMLATLEA
jgi:ADP-heptose:LPS heptosyltransferase